MHIRLDDLLLQEVERTLVLHLLTQLHHSSVGVLDRVHNAVFARLGFDDESHHEGLLKNHVKHFLLDRHVYLDTTGMRLSPDELCIDQLDLFQTYTYKNTILHTLNLFQT